eukprot:1128210_1
MQISNHNSEWSIGFSVCLYSMTSILRDWLEKADIAWERDNKLEDVFGNGYLIGQLLCNLEVGGLNQESFDEQFVNDVSIEAMTENYKLIAQYLCDGGIDIKPKLLQDIANHVSGAIHRFIYDLKCFVDRTERETMSQTANRSGDLNLKGLNQGTSSFKSPPRITSPTRNRKYKYERMQKRDVELKIRKLATEQFLKRSETKWQKYRDHAIEIQQEAEREQEFETQLKNERILQQRDALVKTLKDNHQKREHDDTMSKQDWIKNQKIKRKRISEKQYFETTQRLKQLKTQNIKRSHTANDVEQCLDEFENILSKTQRVQKDEHQEDQASELQTNDDKEKDTTKELTKEELTNEDVEIEVEDPLEHLEKLRHQLPEQTVSMKQTQAYLEQVKVNVAKQREEAMQRQQRRKKLLADEMALNQAKAEEDRQKELNDIVQQSSQQTKSFDDGIKAIKLQKKIFTENSEFMAQKVKERKQKDEALKLKRDKQHFAIKRVEFKTKLTIETQKLKELTMKQEQHQHVRNIKYCKTLARSIVDITYKSVLYRQLSDQQTVPDQLWSEWMHCLSPPRKTQHVLSNIDERNKDKEIGKDLQCKLDKEKQCHSDIAHIKNGLIECMDLHGSINRLLINETELNNYLNAQGIWMYGDATEEPSTDRLGAIIQEIVAVSEGPDPRYQKIIPDVPIAIALIGKPFVGKSTQAQQIADKYALQIIDAERCIKDAMDSFESCDDGEAESLNRTQQIGQRLKTVLDEGKTVDDALYIDVIFDAIISAKEDEKQNGWILDGFPMQRSQCELLEAKLSGYVDTAAPNTGKISKKKPSKIAPPNAEDNEEDTKIESGLDFVFYLDINPENENANEVLFNRAQGRLVDKESGRVYHVTDNPPPADQPIKERLSAPPDEEYVAALPEHFKAFDERKSELREWFDRFGTWTELDCDQDRSQLTVSLLEMIEKRIESKKERQTHEALEAEKEDDEAKEETADTEATEQEPTQTEETPATTEEAEAANDDVEEATDNNTITMPWDESLKDQNMCRRLHYFWCNVEESYIADIKRTFELLRHERRRILAYLASTREYFYNFLRRADGKQTMIDEFQRAFNDIPRDMRRDDDTKDELHQRVQELSFKLFEYSMQRKDECMDELGTIKDSVWLQTESETLLNILIGVIQYEFHRYAPTVAIIQDYFALKHDQSISEDSMEPIDLLSIIEENNASQKGKKGGKNKTDNEDASGMQLLVDKLENAVNIGLQQMVQTNNNESAESDDENVRFNALQCDIINEENQRYKMRLMRLNKILSIYAKDVEDRHLDLLQKLDQWVGLRIDSENDAINSLVKHIQEAIENEFELNYRLILEGENFLIDRDVIVSPMPDPIQKQQSNHEFSTKGIFTAPQLQQLIELLRSQNANGIIEYSSISQIFKRLSANAYGQNEPILPAAWNNLNDAQLYLLLSAVIVPRRSNKYVNWKLLVVSLMLQTVSVINRTVVVPSLDTLFDLKQALNAKDKDNTGKLNDKQFGQVKLWFDNSANCVWQNILFDLFEYNEKEEKSINYNELLFHLCFNDQSHCGFEKIVSLSDNINIVQNTHQITNKCMELIEMRGINNVQIENGSELPCNDKITVQQIKQNEEISASFNFVYIEQLLKQ